MEFFFFICCQCCVGLPLLFKKQMGILCPHWQNSLYSKKHRINLSNRICHLAIDLHCIFKVNVVPICAGVYHHGLYFQSILSACFNLLVVLRKITEFFFMMENSPQQTEAQFEFWLMGPGLYSCQWTLLSLSVCSCIKCNQALCTL